MSLCDRSNTTRWVQMANTVRAGTLPNGPTSQGQCVCCDEFRRDGEDTLDVTVVRDRSNING